MISRSETAGVLQKIYEEIEQALVAAIGPVAELSEEVQSGIRHLL